MPVTFMLLIAASLSPLALGMDCRYRIDASQSKISWSAFRYNERTRVEGTFASGTLQSSSGLKSLKALFRGLKIIINPTTIVSGNRPRDLALKAFFSTHLKGDKQIRISFTKWEGLTDGKATAQVRFNGVSQPIEANFSHDTAAEMVHLSGSFSLLNDFNLADSFVVLEKECGSNCTGGDQTQKLWPDVELNADIAVKMDCKQKIANE